VKQLYTVDIRFTTSVMLTVALAAKLWERAEDIRAVTATTYDLRMLVESIDPFVALIAAARVIETSLRRAGIAFVIVQVAAEPFGVAALTLVKQGEQG
jgi:hypothetical protein